MEQFYTRVEHARGFHVAWRPWQASSCVLARMRAALPSRRLRWTGAGDPHRITVGGPYPLFSGFCKIGPNFELKSKIC